MNAKGQKVKKKDGKNLSVIGLCISDHYYTFIFINIEWLLETETKKYCVKRLLSGLFHVLYQAS